MTTFRVSNNIWGPGMLLGKFGHSLKPIHSAKSKLVIHLVAIKYTTLQ